MTDAESTLAQFLGTLTGHPFDSGRLHHPEVRQ